MNNRQQLLHTTALGEFLRLLRGDDSFLSVQERLAAHGGPSTAQAIAQYESREKISSKIQLAYSRAFRLDDELRLHLQRLAGEAAGCPPLVGGEQAA